MNRTEKIAAGAAGGVVAIGGGIAAYFLLTQGTTQFALRRTVNPANPDRITEWVSRDGNEVRFVSREGAPTFGSWTRGVYVAAIPAGAHEVPVIEPRRTPLVPEGFNRFNGERVKYLDAIRRTIRGAGLNWDARVLMLLWAVESGWDRAVYGNNQGNIKSQGTVYARSFPELRASKRVFVTVADSVGVSVFGDRVRSIDGYHAFATPEAYARYTARLMGSYPGALAALEGGGLAGAQAFARALYGGARKYSPAPVATQVEKYTGGWNASERLIGAARWVR